MPPPATRWWTSLILPLTSAAAFVAEWGCPRSPRWRGQRLSFSSRPELGPFDGYRSRDVMAARCPAAPTSRWPSPTTLGRWPCGRRSPRCCRPRREARAAAGDPSMLSSVTVAWRAQRHRRGARPGRRRATDRRARGWRRPRASRPTWPIGPGPGTTTPGAT